MSEVKQARKEQIAKLHRENILRAAAQLFEEKGAKKTSMDDIAKTAQYSKATLYVYFQSKEEIVAAIVLQGMKDITTQIVKAVESPKDFYSRFEMIGFAMVQFYGDYPSGFDVGFLSKLNVEKQEDGEIYWELQKSQRGIYLLMEDFFKDAMGTGVILKKNNVEQLALTYISGLIGVIETTYKRGEYITQTLNTSQEVFLKNSFKTMVDTLIHGGTGNTQLNY